MGEDVTTMQLCPFLANSLGEETQRRLDLPAAQCKEVQFPCFLRALCKSGAGIILHMLSLRGTESPAPVRSTAVPTGQEILISASY